MKKSFWLKLCVLTLAMSMVLSFVACSNGKIDGTTEATKQETTEDPGKETTQAPTTNTTEAPNTETTEAPNTETTEGPQPPVTTETKAPATTEPVNTETTEAPKDSETCEHDYQWQSNSKNHWKECSKCDDIIDKDNHVTGNEYSSYDETQHWKECSVCHGKVDAASHGGAYEKIDGEKHRQVCSDCNKAYGEADHDYNRIVDAGQTHKCVCGDTTACPAADAECLEDESGHWYTKTCELCQRSSEKQAHNWQRGVDEQSGKNVRECIVCSRKEYCDGDHIEKSEAGHKIGENCDVCGVTKTDDFDPHEWNDPVDNSRTCKVCGYVDLCILNHYETNETSHRVKEDCAICQMTAETDMTPHDEGYTLDIVKSGNTVTYKYICATCGYAYDSFSFSGDVNYFSAPGQMVENYNSTPSLVIDEDGAYTHVVFGTSGQVRLHNTDAKTTMASVDDVITGGPGKYAVMKIRMGGTSLGQLKLGLYDGNTPLTGNTDAIFDGAQNVRTVTDDMIIADNGWIIYVVDLSSINQTYYDVNDAATSLISAGLKIMNGKGTTDTDYIDIAYFAIVDNWEEAASVIGPDAANIDVKLAPVWSDASKDINRKGDGDCVDTHVEGYREVEGSRNSLDGGDDEACYTCRVEPYCTNCGVSLGEATDYRAPHNLKNTETRNYDVNSIGTCYSVEHVMICTNSGCTWRDGSQADVAHKLSQPTISTTTEGTVYTYVCSDENCTHNTFTRTVPTNANFYSAPSQIVNNWATANVESTGGDCSTSRNPNAGPNNGSRRETLTDLRADANGAFTRVHLYQGGSFYLTNGTATDTSQYQESATVDALNGGLGSYVVVKLRANTTWLKISVVTDTGKTYAVGRSNPSSQFETYVIDISSIKDADAQSVRVMMYANTGITAAGSYVDVAYLAIVDNWDAVAAVVGGKNVTVKYVSDWSKPSTDVERTADNTCVNHVIAVREEDVVPGDGTNPDVCYTYTKVEYCSACGLMEEIRTENQEKGHDKTTQEGDGKNYNHSEGEGVCYVQSTSEGCSNCTWSTGSSQNVGHTVTAPVTTTEGENTVHTYSCSGGCGKTWTNTVTANVNYYYSPTAVVAGHNAKSAKIYTDGGFTYTRVMVGESSSFKLNGTSASKINDNSEAIKDGSGQYIVMKIRVGSVDLGQLKLGLYDGKNEIPLYENTTIINTDKLFDANVRSVDQTMVDAGWQIYVVDIANLLPEWYNTNDASVTSISAGFKIANSACKGDTESDWYIDIAYFAIVDNWNEVTSVVGSENTNVEFVAKWTDPSKDATRKANGECVDHSIYTEDTGKVYGEGVNGDVCYTTTVTVKCSNCDYDEDPKVSSFGHKLGAPVITTDAQGNTVYTYTCTEAGCGDSFTRVQAAGTNYYSAPGHQVYEWACGIVPLQAGTAGAGYYNKNSFMVNTMVDSVYGVYNRVYLNQGGHFYLADGVAASNTHTSSTFVDGVTGGVGQFAVLRVRVNDNGLIRIKITTETGANIGFVYRTPADGFVTYVIDISSLKNTDVSKIRVYIGGSEGTPAVPANSSIDIAYFAIVDDWNEVEAVVGEDEKVVYTTDFKVPAKDTIRYSNGACIGSHTCSLSTSTVEATTTYTYSCSNCDFEEVRTVTLDADSINYYIAPNDAMGLGIWNTGTAAGKWNNNVGNVMYDPDEKTIYSSIGFWQGGAFEFTNGTSTPVKGLEDAADTINGLGRYAVLKVRLGEGMNSGLSFGLWDGQTGTSVNPNNANNKGSDYLCKHRNVANGEWMTFVIDLTAFSAHYTVGGTSDKIGVALKNGWTSGTASTASQVDIAYFAICDSWTAIDSIVGDDDVLFTKWTTTEGDTTYTAAQIDQLAVDEQAQ